MPSRVLPRPSCTLPPQPQFCVYRTLPTHRARSLWWSLLLGGILLGNIHAPAALLDTWRAQDVNLNDGDSVGTRTSVNSRSADAASGKQPLLRLNATPAGTKSVRFTGTHRMTAPNSPVGGRSAFSMAIVFKASASGVNDNTQWWGKTGLVDAEEPGVQSDWGTVMTETGQVGIGTGNGDVSTYSSGTSLVDNNFALAQCAGPGQLLLLCWNTIAVITVLAP